MEKPISVGRSDAPSLLQLWCDGLLVHQIAEGEDRGGLMCPACQVVHGRCGDAVYPFLAMFARTRDEKYRRAALEVFGWSQRHVSQPDGSFLNENYVGAWKGITCFSALSLGEALRHYGEHLTPETREIWSERLRRAADFLLDWMDFEKGAINYQFLLQSLYKNQVERVKRSMRLLPDRSVTLQDEWTTGAKAAQVSWQWLTKADVTRTQNGVLLQQSGESLGLQIAASAPYEVEIEDVSQPRNPQDSPNPGLRRIVVRLHTPAQNQGHLKVEAIPGR